MYIKILDCTLRDGGFINQWLFGENVIKSFIQEYNNTCVEFIECGYIVQDTQIRNSSTKFNSFESFPFCSSNGLQDKLICMVDFGKVNEKVIPNREMTSIDGIRVAFHKKDLNEAIQYCKKIKEKGYKVFVHPMNTPVYSDAEFKDMICKVNDINPYAFYIVDSFGDMWPVDCQRYMNLVTQNLSLEILVGFHFHNNFQQALSNALSISTLPNVKHTLIFDTSICGVGRGGGNLDILQWISYLNKNHETTNIKPFLKVIDGTLNEFLSVYNQKSKLEFLIAAYFHCHPNYAQFLKNLEIFNYEDIYNIFSMFADEQKNVYHEGYVTELYKIYREKY